MRRLGWALAVLVGILGAAAPAQAGLRWGECREGGRCARLRVPLDRSGAVPGTVGLRIARLPAPRRRAPVLLYLSGGPGGAGVSEMVDVVRDLPAVARRFRVYGFDQRGTGASGLLRCPGVERDTRLRSPTAGEACARRLGVRRSFYTTPDSVEDMEAIRRAIGARKLTLFGISYGTALALSYARAHPDRVERLILDSVADPDDADPFGLAGFRAMGSTLRALCPARCRGVTRDPAADLAALTARLRAWPLAGWVPGSDGRKVRRVLRPTAIADLLYDADYEPALRAGVPVAVRAALEHGDAAPMLRLLGAGAVFAAPLPARYFSAARYAAVCEETPLPWPRGTPVADRLAVARERATALRPGAFAPFDADVAFADEIGLCGRWPDPVRVLARSGGPYPAVPTLILQGEEDLRTPPEASARVAERILGAVRVTVPGVGHAVLPADPSGCARRRLLRWLGGAGAAVGGRCPRVRWAVPRTAVPPVAFAALAPAPGLRGRVGRTVSALDATLDDLGFVLSPGLGRLGGAGLRGGSYRVQVMSVLRLRLRGLVVVPGVRVTGAGGASGAMDLRIGGSAAAHGRVTVSPSGVVAGRLGGRRVRARLANRPPRFGRGGGGPRGGAGGRRVRARRATRPPRCGRALAVASAAAVVRTP